MFPSPTHRSLGWSCESPAVLSTEESSVSGTRDRSLYLLPKSYGGIPRHEGVLLVPGNLDTSLTIVEDRRQSV